MQIRMLARRCPDGSMTLLGDLAQGIGVWAVDHWEDLVAQLPAHRHVLVASNDRRVQQGASRHGANVISTEQLLVALRRCPASRSASSDARSGRAARSSAVAYHPSR